MGTDRRLTELNKIERELRRDFTLKKRGVSVEIRRNWLPSFDFSARIALLNGEGEEIDHGCVLRHQFLDGSHFETRGASKGCIELASDLKGHTAEEVIEIWRKMA